MNENILIVEDEEALRMTLQDRLRSEGYVVDLAVHGEEGTEKATQLPFDLIILDIMLPGRMHGHTARGAGDSDSFADGPRSDQRKSGGLQARGGRLCHQTIRHPGAHGTHRSTLASGAHKNGGC